MKRLARFAAQAEAQLTGQLTAVAGSCGPGSLHFINGLFEANRNRAPVILIASQIIRDELGFDFIQEVDFKQIYNSCSVFCDMIYTAEQARRKTVIACQTALAKRGVAVLIVPADVSAATVHNDVPYAVHVSKPVIRPSDTDLTDIAKMLNEGEKIAVYAGSGCQGAHKEILAVADKLKAPIAHTSRGKDFLEFDNPYNVGMTGMLGNEAGYHALLSCDTLLLLGADFAWRQFYPSEAKIVQVDIDPTHLGRRHPIAKGVVGDVRATLEALLPKLADHSDVSFRNEYVKRYGKAMQSQRAKAVAAHDGTIPGTYLTEVIKPTCSQRCVVLGGRWHSGGLAMSSHRNDWSAAYIRQSPARNDGLRRSIRHWSSKGSTRPSSDCVGGRWRPFDAFW